MGRTGSVLDLTLVPVWIAGVARPLRLEYAATLYHLTARGNARADILVDGNDRRRFLGEKTLCAPENQEAFRAWVYLLRRVANLPLQAVANRSKVSPSRISKIQRAMETGGHSKVLQERTW